MRTRSKRYKKDLQKVSQEPIPLDDAIQRLKSLGQTKFDQTIDLVCHLGIDARQADQMIRGSVGLPKGIGRSRRVIAFCGDGDVEAAKEAGAIEAGGEELVAKVQKGWLDFDVAIAHPSMMGKVGKLGRVLGPQGKMPTPKSGTVTPDVAQAVSEFAAGRLEFRNDDGGNVHLPVGKVSFDDADLKANIEAVIAHFVKIRPSAAKGQYIKRVCLAATRTPSVTLEASA